MMVLVAEFDYLYGNLLFNPDAINVEAELEECFSDKRIRTFKTSGWFKIIMEHHSTIKCIQIERIGIGMRGKLRLAMGHDTPEEYFDVELRSFRHHRWRWLRRKSEIYFRGRRFNNGKGQMV